MTDAVCNRGSLVNNAICGVAQWDHALVFGSRRASLSLTAVSISLCLWARYSASVGTAHSIECM